MSRSRNTSTFCGFPPNMNFSSSATGDFPLGRFTLTLDFGKALAHG